MDVTDTNPHHAAAEKEPAARTQKKPWLAQYVKAGLGSAVGGFVGVTSLMILAPAFNTAAQTYARAFETVKSVSDIARVLKDPVKVAREDIEKTLPTAQEYLARHGLPASMAEKLAPGKTVIVRDGNTRDGQLHAMLDKGIFGSIVQTEFFKKIAGYAKPEKGKAECEIYIAPYDVKNAYISADREVTLLHEIRHCADEQMEHETHLAREADSDHRALALLIDHYHKIGDDKKVAAIMQTVNDRSINELGESFYRDGKISHDTTVAQYVLRDMDLGLFGKSEYDEHRVLSTTAETVALIRKIEKHCETRPTASQQIKCHDEHLRGINDRHGKLANKIDRIYQSQGDLPRTLRFSWSLYTSQVDRAGAYFSHVNVRLEEQIDAQAQVQAQSAKPVSKRNPDI